MTDELKAKQTYCAGCRDDFYNHGHHSMNGEYCWHLRDAQVVERYRVGWWTPQDSARNFERVTTLSCHAAPGQYAQYADLPEHLRGERELARDAR